MLQADSLSAQTHCPLHRLSKGDEADFAKRKIAPALVISRCSVRSSIVTPDQAIFPDRFFSFRSYWCVLYRNTAHGINVP